MNQSSSSRWVASPQRLLSTGSATIGSSPLQRWSLATSSMIVRMGPQVGHIPSAVLIDIQNTQDRDRVHCRFRRCLAAECRPTRRTRNALPHLYSARRSQANLPDGMIIDSARQALWSLPIDRNQNRTILGKPASARFLCGSISSLVGDLIQRARSHRINRRSYLGCRATKPIGSVPWNCSNAFPRVSHRFLAQIQTRALRRVLCSLNRHPVGPGSVVHFEPGQGGTHPSCPSVQPPVSKRTEAVQDPGGSAGGLDIQPEPQHEGARCCPVWWTRSVATANSTSSGRTSSSASSHGLSKWNRTALSRRRRRDSAGPAYPRIRACPARRSC